MGNSSSRVHNHESLRESPSLLANAHPTEPQELPSYTSLPPFTPTRLSGSSETWYGHSTRNSIGPGAILEQDHRIQDGEDRPLFESDIAQATSTGSRRSTSWRYSTMSRLGSRFLPDAVARNLVNSGEESPEEGEALREGRLSRRRPSVHQRRVTQVSNERFSVAGSLRRRNAPPDSRPARRSVRALFRSTTDHEILPNDAPQSTPPSNQLAESEQTNLVSTHGRRSTRFSRVRRSISSPFSNMLGPSTGPRSRRFQSPSVHPSRSGQAEESRQLLRQSLRQDSNQEHEHQTAHELDAVELETRNVLSNPRIASSISAARRFPRLRSRSTRLINRSENPPLSQVLQLAAAAIAAQLSGSSLSRTDASQPPATEAWDGSIQSFVRTLQDAASAQAGEHVDLNANEIDLPPVNFMRVFQFPNDENGTPLATQPSPVDDVSAVVDGDRSVTLVLVGVRSMPNIHDETSPENGVVGPSLDTLLSLPFLPPANILRNGSSGALFRRSDNRSSTRIRRHSMTNFPHQYDGQRFVRRPGIRPAGDAVLSASTPNATLMSDSPPGPNPPPSTPADMRSGEATPVRRPSSASLRQAAPLAEVNEEQTSEVGSMPENQDFALIRQRRRSDSEFARRPELSSGNSRRNGVVEPDRPSVGAGRSWLIYVVGTNVSPDHPAFTMPSLFTDNPSYEDMQMLSTLLGPAKPSVASQEDVAAAGGLFQVSRRNHILFARPLAGDVEHAINITAGDRCLICLCEYEDNEQVRQLDTCRHMYHRECIDEVSHPC